MVLVSGKVTVEVVPESRRADVEVLPLQEGGPPPPPAPTPPPSPGPLHPPPAPAPHPHPPSPATPCHPPSSGPKYERHPGWIGSDILNGDLSCSSVSACPAEAQAYCEGAPSCRSYAIDPAWKGKGQVAAAQVYKAGFSSAHANPAWTLWVRQCLNTSSQPPVVAAANVSSIS